MTSINRRQFVGAIGAFAATATPPMPAVAQAKPKVVVIGGGPGGATAAKYVAKGGGVDVTLIEPADEFVTCFHSNLYLGGIRTFQSITHSYQGLISKYGIRHARHAAEVIDRDRRTVRLANGDVMPYDRLLLAPGIDLKFESVPGYSEAAAERMPHAWKAGPQTQLLKRQLDALEDGSLIVMIAPPNPYRCPPAPYERVSIMAYALKAKGHKKSRIIVLDTKDAFSKQAVFMEGWQNHYPGMIEWQDPKMHGGIERVDPANMTVVSGLSPYKAALVNVIPAQMAGKIARDTGLVDESGFCPIKPENMTSAADGNIYIVGDACISGDMPKSAFSANSQAKVAALMIRGELASARTFPARYANICWSMIESQDTVKIGGRYEPQDGKIAASATFVSKTGETKELRRKNQKEYMGWYAGITADMFG